MDDADLKSEPAQEWTLAADVGEGDGHAAITASQVPRSFDSTKIRG